MPIRKANSLRPSLNYRCTTEIVRLISTCMMFAQPIHHQLLRREFGNFLCQTFDKWFSKQSKHIGAKLDAYMRRKKVVIVIT